MWEAICKTMRRLKNIKINRQEMERQGAEWIQVAHDSVQWRNKIINF
jgi:hypothetical protein